jgi:maltooligosyltrehalose trehalohydrolase
MTHFSLWAPERSTVSVQVSGKNFPMRKDGDRGYWSADVLSAKPGDDYGFLLDDETRAYPDPRSLQQPDGVHGLSRIVDLNAYAWQDANYQPPAWPTAVIYEVHTGTFTPEGTFAAAAEKLGYLRDLGITHVELLPVNSFPGHWGWGYDGVSLFAPQEDYGGPAGLQAFVDRAHALGLAVIMDVVYNHFGPDGNYTGLFGPYITESHHTPWGGAINFEEGGSTEVRRFFCDNALSWLRDFHIDGLRLDAVTSYVDRSAVHFLEQLATEVEMLSAATGRRRVLIAESDLNDPRVMTPRNTLGPGVVGGFGLDAQWSDDFHHSLFAFLTGERQSYYVDFGTLAQLAKSLRNAYVYDGTYSSYRQRLHGRPINGLDGTHFLGYIQNHDMVGNRPQGDRIHAVGDTHLAKLAAALVFTAPFIPMVFQGEEFAADAPFLYFADHTDPDLAQAVSEGRRKEHAHHSDAEIPDPESEDTFLRSKIDWSQRTQPEHADMLNWYRSLIQLRMKYPALHDGRLDLVTTAFDEKAKWLTLQRQHVHVFFNFGDTSVTLDTEANVVLLQSDKAINLIDQQITLPCQSCAILSTEGL